MTTPEYALCVFLHWAETSSEPIAVRYREQRGTVSRHELALAYLDSASQAARDAIEAAPGLPVTANHLIAPTPPGALF